MKRIIKLFLISSCIGILWHPKIYAQKKFIGIPITEHFNANDFKGFPSSDAITQDSRGLIYIGNVQGLLIFDGTNWEQFYTKIPGRFLSALCEDPSGKILVGSHGDFGYYFPGPTGTHEYHSLSYLLPKEHHLFPGAVQKIIPYKGGYVFASHNNLYFYENDTIKIIPTAYPDGASASLVRGKLYMNVKGKGLSVLHGEEWEMIPNGSFFADMMVLYLFSYSNETMLACTVEDGIYLINNQQVLPFAKTLWNDFRKYKIISSIKLSDGSFAIGTLLNGLYILDQTGNLVFHFNENNGLENMSAITHIFQDSYGNIWVAQANGLTKIEWESPFRLINDKVGLTGAGITAYASEDRIYFGTTKGLYYAEKNRPLDKVIQVENISGPVINIQSINGDILVCSANGAYQLINNAFEQISLIGGWHNFRETRDPNIIIGLTHAGFFRLLKTNGKWKVSNKYNAFDMWVLSFEFDKDDRLWVASHSEGVFSHTFSEDYEAVITTNHYDTTKGFPTNMYTHVYKIEDDLIFSTAKGIYVYSPTKDEFIPSPVWNKRFERNKFEIYNMSVDGFGNIYYVDTVKPGRLKKNKQNEYTNEYSLFNSVGFHRQNGLVALSILNDDNIVFGFPFGEGFIHYDRESQPATHNKTNLLIRSVKLSRSDSVLFGGNFISDKMVVDKQPSDMIPILSYEDHSLVFGYSATEYNKNNSLYRYQLEGFDAEWSRWTDATEKEYTNLYEGSYTFKVQIRYSNDQISPETTYQFEILPPWHRTYLAYSGYTIGILGFLFFIFSSYKRRKKKEITQLKNEKLESEIQHKKSQLAASTMHLIDKSEFINSIKNYVGEILKHDSETNVDRQLKRIIKEIDRNNSSDDNWDDFEIHFDEVHEDFLKRIRHDYPAITAREIRLCAYLRMNMSTKEITDLLKISVRGVEVARYRLRKKLNINTDDNLVGYMLNY
jgi:ligand-binding sensor domain-containing protein/DNA-binding CsgD family transcriptional regulator